MLLIFLSFQLKSVGPKLVPFFKTVTIFFVLFGEDSYLESVFYCIIKCLPIVSLIFFVLLHGMNFSEAYSYSRKILAGLIFSGLGDAFLVWKRAGYFQHGLVMFALAQLMYASAFGMRPFKLYVAAPCFLIGGAIYAYLFPGLQGAMVWLGGMYMILIMFMAWRAIARVQIFNDLWTWTKLCSCLGAVAFIISDLVIAVDKFRFKVPYSHPMIMTTYYAAQLGIALSVVDSQVDELLKKTAWAGNGCLSEESCIVFHLWQFLMCVDTETELDAHFIRCVLLSWCKTGR